MMLSYTKAIKQHLFDEYRGCLREPLPRGQKGNFMNKYKLLFAAGMASVMMTVGCAAGGKETVNKDTTAKTEEKKTDTFKQKQAEAKDKKVQQETSKQQNSSKQAKSGSSSTTTNSPAVQAQTSSTEPSDSLPASMDESVQPSYSNETAYSQEPNEQAVYAPVQESDQEYAAADQVPSSSSESLDGEYFKDTKSLNAAMQAWKNADPENFAYYNEEFDQEGHKVYHLFKSNKQDNPEAFKELFGDKS